MCNLSPQVRVTTSNINGKWSNPEKLQLSAVLPPMNIGYNPRNSRFRRSLDVDGNALVIEAMSVDISWQPPPPSSAFTFTGYDVLLFNSSVAGYEKGARELLRMFDEVCANYKHVESSQLLL